MNLDITKLTNKTEVIVRFSDTDAMGIVHVNRYFIYFEDGFVSLLDSIGFHPSEHIKEGIVFPIVESHCNYESSAKFGDTLVILTKIKSVSTHSLTCSHEVRRRSDNTLLAHGTLVRVCYSLDNEKIPVDTIFSR
ncbi:MAG: YbgC/FadM family acyl-CoA thioesterase [Candidatus Lokiarchaeota archaeon]|nr:YbgC/FadM family acyl-CoA thioesterase [Candidatus Lokiarchaeota archaeon]